MNASIIDFRSRSLRAFSLSELLVVLVIVGILVLIALTESHAFDLAGQSLRGATATHLSAHVAEVSFLYLLALFVVDGGARIRTVDVGHRRRGANYLIEIAEASEHGFRATATAVVDFDGDGVYNVWEIDEQKHLRETVKD